ncbi:MAG: UDP-glucose dehydrogenase family protein [Desulfobacca sp.]|uniref:UDP-glucose dehydrogenase family protein n=1 Tax=Desulfobacca sp. TaxID=2067990 RepID=UPI00404A3814
MHLAMIGVGYVGLVSGACFAEAGQNVICMDVDPEKIDGLRQGQIPIYEPGLEDFVRRNVAAGRLSFTTDVHEAVDRSQVIFICVGTPSRDDGSADLHYVDEVARGIGRTMDEYKVIVNKSTVPVGTARRVRRLISKELARRGLDLEFDVVSNPEFLREGSALHDFMQPDRTVVGVESPKARDIMAELYRYWTEQNYPLYFMEVASAEMTKYAANAFLATKITFMNEIANLCALSGANIDEVRVGIGSDKRIGDRFLYPGLGYGGSCFPKDVKALIYMGKTMGYTFSILEATNMVNQAQRHRFIFAVSAYFDHQLDGRTIALWGLAFKPNTDDIREAPSLTVMERLLDLGADLRVYDPVAMPEVQRYYEHYPYPERIFYAASPEAAAEGADALVINTEWDVFRQFEVGRLKDLLQRPVVFDGRNIYDPVLMTQAGLEYFYIGKPSC